MMMMMMMMIMMMTILLSIPDPGTIEPLEHKLPKDIGSEGADFTLKCLDKVNIIMMMIMVVMVMKSVPRGVVKTDIFLLG